MVRQHNSQSQCSTGNQGIAQCTLITDDRINTGEHDGSSRDKEYSADNRAGDTGKNVCQLGAKSISQEDKSGNLSYSARACPVLQIIFLKFGALFSQETAKRCRFDPAPFCNGK